jgi:MoxR-like ATPase
MHHAPDRPSMTVAAGTADAGDADAGADQITIDADSFRHHSRALLDAAQRQIVGYDRLITDVLVAVFSQGHVLLEGVPGLGKTFLVKVLAKLFGFSFGRIQCTPDLMPSDVLGTHVIGEDVSGHRSFRFEKGPVFRQLLLVDEVNRTTPKTQAALLEVMQEHTVTAGTEQFTLPEPFFVLATQNPLEMEGTYPLPEAQLDRFFFKLQVPFPDVDALVEISRRTTGSGGVEAERVMTGEDLVRFQRLLTEVPIAEPLLQYAARIVLSTHPDHAQSPPSVRSHVAYGASPRGMQAIVRAARAYALLAGRTCVAVEDVRFAVLPALRHRVILNFEGQAEQVSVDTLLGEVIASVPTPAREAA